MKKFLKILKYVLPLDLVCVILSYFLLIFGVEKLYNYYDEISSFEPLINSMVNNLDLSAMSSALETINQSLANMYFIIFVGVLLLFMLMMFSQSINWKISSDGAKRLFENYNEYFWNFVLISFVFLVLPLLFLNVFGIKIFFFFYLVMVYFCLIGYGLLNEFNGAKLFNEIFVRSFKEVNLLLVYLGLLVFEFGCFVLFMIMSNIYSFLISGLVCVVLALIGYAWVRFYFCGVLGE